MSSLEILPLDEAIRRTVRPGMTLHFGVIHYRPSALVWELVRQFWGHRPGFTVVSAGITGPFHALVQGRLVARIVSSFCGDTYPAPAPHPLYQRAFVEDADVELESWSILSLAQRLLASAQGLPFAPTRSLVGSSMESNEGVVRLTDSAGVSSLGVVPLQPDLSFLHGAMADEQGNVVFTPPFGEGAIGAMAAREGAVVSVERLASAEEIRRHSHLVLLPGTFVRALSVVPFGAHPAGLSGHGIEGFPGYAEDYDFMDEFTELSRKEDLFASWIEQHVAGRTHEDYLRMLGPERLLFLIGKADPDAWAIETSVVPPGRKVPEPTVEERMACATAEVLVDRCVVRGYRHILAGIGVAHLGSWLAAHRLSERGRHVALMAELGFFDFTPRPGESFIFNHANIPTCRMTTGVLTMMGTLFSHSTLGVLGAAQVDEFGNLNSTLLPGKQFLLGSGGANDVASVCDEVIVVLPQRPGRLVHRVPYVTAPGRAVRVIVTDRAVYERREGAIRLVGVLEDGSGVGPSDLAHKALEECPWDVEVDRDIAVYDASAANVALLRSFDPRRRFLGTVSEATKPLGHPSGDVQ